MYEVYIYMYIYVQVQAVEALARLLPPVRAYRDALRVASLREDSAEIPSQRAVEVPARPGPGEKKGGSGSGNGSGSGSGGKSGRGRGRGSGRPRGLTAGVSESDRAKQ